MAVVVPAVKSQVHTVAEFCDRARALQFLVSLLPEASQASSALKAKVEEAGGYVCSYIPDHTFRVVLTRVSAPLVAALPGVLAACMLPFAMHQPDVGDLLW